MKSTMIAFDLDDTLYKERDFVASGYSAIARQLAEANDAFDYQEMLHIMVKAPVNPFDSLDEYLTNRSIQQSIEHSFDIPWMVATYRNHLPDINAEDATRIICQLIERGYRIGIITDGRIITQTNKIKALGLDQYISSENISISEAVGGEKYTPIAFERMMSLNGDIVQFIYVGDNPMKDFLWPNRLGWKTIQLLDNGRNVHSQAVAVPSTDYEAQIKISDLSKLLEIL